MRKKGHGTFWPPKPKTQKLPQLKQRSNPITDSNPLRSLDQVIDFAALGNKRWVAGIDEVGRGAWAGPMTLAMVIRAVPEAFVSLDKRITDSKKVHLGVRPALARMIKSKAALTRFAWCRSEEIDLYGLTQSTISAVMYLLDKVPKIMQGDLMVCLDGRWNISHSIPVLSIIKGDSLVPVISEASILAKVARDRYMEIRGSAFPQYGWAQNKGYGTAHHKNALKQWGISPYHRKSYQPIQSLLATP